MSPRAPECQAHVFLALHGLGGRWGHDPVVTHDIRVTRMTRMSYSFRAEQRKPRQECREYSISHQENPS